MANTMIGKKIRIQKTLEMIKSYKDGIEFDKIIAIIVFNFGLRKEVVKSYLETLQAIGAIEMKNFIVRAL